VQRFSIGHDPRRIEFPAQNPIEPISFCRFRLTFVTAAQDGNATSADLQRASEFFDDWSLAGSPNGQVANADDEATQRALPKNSFPIQLESELDDSLVDERERVKNSAQKRSAKSAATAKDDVDAELLEIFKFAAHIVSDE
jgi:hypothetical protein